MCGASSIVPEVGLAAMMAAPFILSIPDKKLHHGKLTYEVASFAPIGFPEPRCCTLDKNTTSAELPRRPFAGYSGNAYLRRCRARTRYCTSRVPVARPALGTAVVAGIVSGMS